ASSPASGRNRRFLFPSRTSNPRYPRWSARRCSLNATRSSAESARWVDGCKPSGTCFFAEDCSPGSAPRQLPLPSLKALPSCAYYLSNHLQPRERKNEAQLTKGQLRLGWAGHARGGGDGGRLPLQFLNGEIVPDR